MADEKLSPQEVEEGLEGLSPDEVRRRLAASPDILAVFDRLRLGLPVRNPRETLAAIRTGLEFTLSKPAQGVAIALVPAKVKNPYYLPAGGQKEFIETLLPGDTGQAALPDPSEKP